MRLVLIALLLVCLAAVYGSPLEREKRAPCETVCPLNYQPVCTKDGNSKPRTFSNECALRVHNCLNKTNYNKIKQGEC